MNKLSSTEEKIVKILKSYISRYADYDLVGFNNGKDLKMAEDCENYSTMCFSTADFIYNLFASHLNNNGVREKNKILKTIEIVKTEDIFLLDRYLQDNFLIVLNIECEYQSHKIILLPINNRVYVIQSVGALLAAFYEVYDSTQLYEKIIKLFLGNPYPLCGYLEKEYKVPNESFTNINDFKNITKSSRDDIFISYDIVERNKPCKLPDLTKYKKRLDFLRDNFFDDSGKEDFIVNTKYKTVSQYVQEYDRSG